MAGTFFRLFASAVEIRLESIRERRASSLPPLPELPFVSQSQKDALFGHVGLRTLPAPLVWGDAFTSILAESNFHCDRPDGFLTDALLCHHGNGEAGKRNLQNIKVELLRAAGICMLSAAE